jgi:hypothetical protein
MPLMRLHSRNLVALILSAIVAISVAQTTGVTPSYALADNKLLIQLSRTPTSTEPIYASGNVEIDPQSGRLTIAIRQASPNSNYLALFATAGNNILLGNVTTDDRGQGNLETTLTTGSYVGGFQILRIGLLQFVSASTAFTVVASPTETQTLSSNNTTPSVTNPVQFLVEPPSRTISSSEFAKFNIQVLVNGTADVVLTASGIPMHGRAIFTRNIGIAKPEFHSDLIIMTSRDTPVGSYRITVVALVNGQEFNAHVNLEVAGYSTVTSNQTTTSTAAGYVLDVSLSTDQLQYQPNATVNIQGYVTDEMGGAIAGASVAVQVDDPTGAEIMFMNSLQTDAAGVFRVNFTLPSNATAGTYTTFASASKSGYVSATTHRTFAVGISPTPSVVIREVYTTDLSGNRSAVFTPGQTAVVWVVVENGGATFDGVIWVQIRDANGTPIWILFQISSVERGQSVAAAFGFQVTTGLSPGLYSANILVSDKLISQGGSFFASANAEFAVAS